MAWLVILGVTAILLVMVLIPRVAGATPYTILTGSMEPELTPGTLVVVRPIDIDEIGIGTVVTYQLGSDKASRLTHRVVARRFNGQSEVQFQTQGDANSIPDKSWVKPAQVLGEKWYAVPYLGDINSISIGRSTQMVAYVLAALLVGYAAFVSTFGSTRAARASVDRSKATP